VVPWLLAGRICLLFATSESITVVVFVVVDASGIIAADTL